MKNIILFLLVLLLVNSCENEPTQVNEKRCPSFCTNGPIESLPCVTKPVKVKFQKCEGYYFIEDTSGKFLISEIEKGILQWGQSLGIKLTRTSSKSKSDIRVENQKYDKFSSIPYQMVSGCEGGEPLGGIDKTKPWITFNENLNWDGKNPESGCESISLKSFILHEMGHAFGLEHVNDPGSLMYCFNLKSQAVNLTKTEITKAKNLLSIYCDSIEMVSVEGGVYTMGSSGVTIEIASFFIGKFEITQNQWFEVMGNNPSDFSGCDNCPVEQVSWDDAQVFVDTLNKKQPGKNYRLPTEAEWEWAAMGGIQSNGYKFAGSNHPEEVAWYRINSNGKPHPVGQKKANELGIYDMSGNVYEWTFDDCDTGKKMNRGGAWTDTNEDHLNVAALSCTPLNLRLFNGGFRVAHD